MTPIRMILALLLSVSLSGCGAISAIDNASQTLEIYELRTPRIAATGGRRNVEVIVETPSATSAIETERIMIRPTPLRAQYLPDVRWSDTAPVMVQTLLVRGLIETGKLASVGRSPLGTAADYAVLGELTDFQAESFAGSGPVVRVRIIFRVVRERDARVVATRGFAVLETAASNATDDLVAAFDRATTAALSDAIFWVLANAR